VQINQALTVFFHVYVWPVSVKRKIVKNIARAVYNDSRDKREKTWLSNFFLSVNTIVPRSQGLK